jgi:hypothetical protein
MERGMNIMNSMKGFLQIKTHFNIKEGLLMKRYTYTVAGQLKACVEGPH